MSAPLAKIVTVGASFEIMLPPDTDLSAIDIQATLAACLQAGQATLTKATLLCTVELIDGAQPKT